MSLAWLKIKVGYEIIKLGYNYFTIDVDGAFLRPVLPAILNVFEKTGGADMAMLTINTAFGLIRATKASISFMEWYLHHSNHSVNKGRDNELTFHDLMRGHSGAFWCKSLSTCNPRAPGVAAIASLPSIFPGGNCYAPTFNDGLCSDRRLFVHSLCGTGRSWKEWSLRSLGLWFLEDLTGNSINTSSGYHQELVKCPVVTAWSSEFAAAEK